MARYKYIIFDVDDTLLDFGCAFHTAPKSIDPTQRHKSIRHMREEWEEGYND